MSGFPSMQCPFRASSLRMLGSISHYSCPSHVVCWSTESSFGAERGCLRFADPILPPWPPESLPQSFRDLCGKLLPAEPEDLLAAEGRSQCLAREICLVIAGSVCLLPFLLGVIQFHGHDLDLDQWSRLLDFFGWTKKPGLPKSCFCYAGSLNCNRWQKCKLLSAPMQRLQTGRVSVPLDCASCKVPGRYQGRRRGLVCATGPVPGCSLRGRAKLSEPRQ